MFSCMASFLFKNKICLHRLVTILWARCPPGDSPGEKISSSQPSPSLSTVIDLNQFFNHIFQRDDAHHMYILRCLVGFFVKGAGLQIFNHLAPAFKKQGGNISRRSFVFICFLQFQRWLSKPQKSTPENGGWSTGLKYEARGHRFERVFCWFPRRDWRV